MSIKEAIKEIKQLNPTEKLEIVEEIWDSIEVNSLDLPISNDHKKILEKRILDYKNNPNSVITLDQFKKDIESEIKGYS